MLEHDKYMIWCVGPLEVAVFKNAYIVRYQSSRISPFLLVTGKNHSTCFHITFPYKTNQEIFTMCMTWIRSLCQIKTAEVPYLQRSRNSP